MFFVVYALLSVYKEFDIIKLFLYVRNSIISCATFVIYMLLNVCKKFEVSIIYKAITIYTYYIFVIKQKKISFLKKQ